MKVLIINGPNLNLLGLRQPEVYGKLTYNDLLSYCQKEADKLGIEVNFFQSNHEGAIIDVIQDSYNKVDGIIINAGAYTHYSIAIMDALKSVNIPTIEVHLSDIYKREEYRHISYIKEASIASFVGLGFEGYKKALIKIKENIGK
ncbi:MAG: type II 3-dehydroquinate dehydratase [Bacillales bacterium]|nr:type II 3-dehydroquinate dehydratase [Bacillales bacterium]